MKPSSYLPVFIILVAGLISGCAGTITGSKQQQLNPKNLTQLEKGRETTDFWRGKDLTLSYKYHLTGPTLKINGTIALSKHLTNYTVMDHLRLNLYFVDAGGNIVSRTLIYAAPHRRWIPMLNLSFNRLITVPPGVEALAFTYDGKVSDGMNSDGGGISWNFWNAL